MTTAGDAEFAQFYTATFHRVAAQLYAYLGDHAEAQDLTQEAFCRALDRWHRVGGYANPGAWVRQVAWNLATSRLRHLQVVKRFVTAHPPEHMPPPGPERVDLTRALATLPPNQRLALVLHHVGQLSTSEIARQRGVAEGTVRSWLSRGRAQLAERLVDWDQARTVAPERGVEAAVAKVRRRRTARRATLAAVLALLIVIPLAVLLWRHQAEPPVIDPTPPPSSGPGPEIRRVNLPAGVKVSMSDVQFADRDHAWLWHRPCRAGEAAQPCQLLAASADGARTWRRIEVPPLPEDATTEFFSSDADTATIQVNEHGQDNASYYLHTTDGGRTFTSHPADRPPTAMVVNVTGQRYRMLCPGQTGAEFGAASVHCEQRQLVKIGEGPVATQPPIRTAQVGVTEGGDGRLWLTGDSPRQLFVSGDGARTWTRLPWPGEEPGMLTLTPDGGQAWIVVWRGSTDVTLWELAGSQWLKRWNGDAHEMAPLLLNDGIWLMNHDHRTLAYFHDGQYTDIVGVTDAFGGYVMRDGTVSLRTLAGIALGVGSGMRRRWVMISQ